MLSHELTMSIGESILLGVAGGCAKFLFKRFVGKAVKPLDEPVTDGAAAGVVEGVAGAAGEGLASGLADLVKDRLKKRR